MNMASAAAFAPVSSKSSSTALSMSYENELGVVAPTGFFGKSVGSYIQDGGTVQ
jgi:hypothetical protein